MEIVFLLVPGSLLLVVIFLVLYLKACRSGQFDDLETPPIRMLFDDVESTIQDRALPEPDHSKKDS